LVAAAQRTPLHLARQLPDPKSTKWAVTIRAKRLVDGSKGYSEGREGSRSQSTADLNFSSAWTAANRLLVKSIEPRFGNAWSRVLLFALWPSRLDGLKAETIHVGAHENQIERILIITSRYFPNFRHGGRVE